MRKLVVLILAVVLLLALGLPATYFVLAKDLPPLQGREQIVHTLAVTIESQRQKELAAVDPRRVQRFAMLGPADLSCHAGNPSGQVPGGRVADGGAGAAQSRWAILCAPQREADGLGLDRGLRNRLRPASLNCRAQTPLL